MKGNGDHRGRTGHALFSFNFLLTVRRIWMFFSLKTSLYQGNHPSKFQFVGVRHFGGVREQTNKQTHSLTSYCFYRVIFFLHRLTLKQQICMCRCVCMKTYLLCSDFLKCIYHLMFRQNIVTRDKGVT